MSTKLARKKISLEIAENEPIDDVEKDLIILHKML